MKVDNGVPAIIPEKPLIYEINTFVWLQELSRKYGKKITLSNIPGKEYDELSNLGFDMIWLMGVWKRSPAGLDIARQHPVIMKELHEALPDLTDGDIAGSPYCIREYQADPFAGGDKGLAKARKELAARGMRLMLDFVPNHVAPDHPWTRSNPDFFIGGTAEELHSQPDHYYQAGKHVFARARDPFYPPWPDVLQLDIFHKGLREALLQTLKTLASQCDGIRCDMAMLVMNDIFSRTWAGKAGSPPTLDFWNYVIPEVKKQFPDFIFLAEAYWDTEPALLNQGFDFCYDKKYYDYLILGADKLRYHIIEMVPIQNKMLRFLENHDETRAAGLFDPFRHKALALAALTLPGATLVHDGQLSGRTVKVPVFLNRRLDEPENADLSKFYRQLLKMLHFDPVRKGKWSVCEVSGWPDNQSCQNLLAWEWNGEHESMMFVINMSDQPSQAHVISRFRFIPGRTYQLFDVISGELYRRDGEEMTDPGLYVVLKPWGMHAFSIEH